ncbi:hypothetical protein AV540_12755 [Brevibacillus parabrevis]|uniref:DUF6143 family protein n=1 Tax=Brevibacillus parabrevis TaxID=54914 RepID=UPI0007ABA6F8|nr:DUF6143 family protein [Brevibacillus parabrevis]KZE51730.1 hypothetical protein AV540_12755 [Brevibacillus parabrevis]
MTNSSYYYGLPDIYMQMGYFPFPTPPPTAPLNRSIPAPYTMPISDPCKHFLGQSEKIVAQDGEHGFASLVNPLRSGVLLYVNQWLITNPQACPLEAHIWFGKAAGIGKAKASAQVTSGYIQLAACPTAQGQIMYGSDQAPGHPDGVFASIRIVPPMATAGEQPNGQWIIGQGMALTIRVPDTGQQPAFYVYMNWWEHPL